VIGRPVKSQAVEPRALAAVAPADAAPLPRSSTVAAQEETHSVYVPVAVSAVAVVPVAVPAASAPPEMSTTISWLADALQATDATTSSARSMIANLATARVVDPVLTAGLESVSNVRAHPASDPLTQVSSPGELRHERLLAALTDTRLSNVVEPTSVTRTHERIVNRLANEGLADDISRLGVEGTQVSFKF
jgi:hypothetical protein